MLLFFGGLALIVVSLAAGLFIAAERAGRRVGGGKRAPTQDIP